MKERDVIIVGAGAAGLTAGIFAARRGLSTLVLSKDLGGQASTTPDIENYPGVELLEGWDLMARFEKKMKEVGALIRFEEVTHIDKVGGIFEVVTSHRTHTATAVILAFGKTPNDLNVPGEENLKGEYIHYAALPDATPYGGKTVAIVGGGNTAVQAALMLAPVTKKVTLLCREATLRAEAVLRDRLTKLGDHIEVQYGVVVKELVGKDHLEAILCEQSGKEQRYTSEHLFVGVGYSNRTTWLKDLVAVDQIGQIIIAPDCSTSTDGIFAAGDVTTIPYKQVVISAGEGAKAAIATHQYIAKKHGQPAVNIDWGTKKIN